MYKITKGMMFWAKGSAIKKRMIAEDRNERRMNAL
jgi:hypothetical protein